MAFGYIVKPCWQLHILLTITEKRYSNNYCIHRRKRMKQINRKMTALFFVLLGVLLFLIPGNSFAAAENSEEVTENAATLLVEGKIRRFNQEQQNVVLQVKKGEKMTILWDWDTTLVGYSSPQEIEKGQKVKIWYSSNDQKLTAVKIEKKLVVGCD